MSFPELTKRISPKLNAIAHKLNGRFTFFNEEDLYQEAMIHLWDKYNKGTLSDKTDSYILQGCFFFLKNYIRKIWKKIDLNSVRLNDIINNDEDAFTFEDILPAEKLTQTSDFIETKILSEDIYNCLNEQEKRVILLSQEGLTTREIGKRLGVSHVRIVKIKANIKRKTSFLLDRG